MVAKSILNAQKQTILNLFVILLVIGQATKPNA